MGKIIEQTEDKIVYQRDDGSTISFKAKDKKLEKLPEERLKILDNQMSYAATLLCMEKPFFGYLLMAMIKEWNYTKPTMSVCTTGAHHMLRSNPLFWETLTEKQRLGLLEHELNHICFFHTVMDISSMPVKEARAIAVDLVVNQYIDKDRLTEDGCFIEDFGFEPDKDAQFYYNEVMKMMQGKDQNQNQNNPCNGGKGGQGQGQGQMETTMEDLQELLDELQKQGYELKDDGTFTDSNGNQIKINGHDYGKDSDTGEKLNAVQIEIIKNQTLQIMNSAAEAAELVGGKGCGNVPGHIVELLKKLNAKQPPRFNYHKFIRRFTGNCEKNFVKSTRMRPNLLIPENPGTVIRGMQNVLVGLDISGSMSSELLTSLQGDLAWLIRKGYEVTLAQFDCALQNVSRYKKNQPLKLYGRGGTDFNPICKFFKENEKKYSCLIVFSDGEAPAPDTDSLFPRQKVLWCFTCNNEQKFPGTKIHIDEQMNLKE